MSDLTVGMRGLAYWGMASAACELVSDVPDADGYYTVRVLETGRYAFTRQFQPASEKSEIRLFGLNKMERDRIMHNLRARYMMPDEDDSMLSVVGLGMGLVDLSEMFLQAVRDLYGPRDKVAVLLDRDLALALARHEPLDDIRRYRVEAAAHYALRIEPSESAS